MDYKMMTLRPPAKEWVRPLLSLYSYWDEGRRFSMWTDDLRYRLEGKGGRELFHVAMDRSNPVAALDVSSSRVDARVGCAHRLFVHPEHRHHGLERSLLKHALEQFQAGGGEFLMLNSGWDTSFYHLYQEFEFREFRRDPWSDGVLMGRTTSGQPVADWIQAYFGPAESAKVVQINAGHWAPLMLLCNQKLPYLVHHYALNIMGDWAVDGRLLGLFDILESGKGIAVGLQTNDRRLVGFATLLPFLDPWPVASYQQHIRLLDLWVHPNFMSYTPQLLRELEVWTHPLPDKVHYLMSMVEDSRSDLIQSLAQESWTQVARLEQRYQLPNDEMIDMIIYRKAKPRVADE